MNYDLKIKIMRQCRTQSDFALETGTHESKVSAVIRGRRKLTPAEAKRLKDVLNSDQKLLESVTRVE